MKALKVARRELNSEAIDKYLLKSGISEYEEQPKYLAVTKRLYRPYDKLFSPRLTDVKPVPTLSTLKLTMSQLK
jgi:hypothetical protein